MAPKLTIFLHLSFSLSITNALSGESTDSLVENDQHLEKIDIEETEIVFNPKIEFDEQTALKLKSEPDIINQNLIILQELHKIQKLNAIVQENHDSQEVFLGFDGDNLDPIYRYAKSSTS